MKQQSIVDFHSHILPRVDHGCANEKEAVRQLRMASQAGISIMIATPHFYPHKESFVEFDARRQKGWKKHILLNKNESFPEVLLGAEVFICRGMERMPELEKLCIQGTKTLLLEMPFRKWSDELMETVIEIQNRRKLTVVLAHVERYQPEQVEILFQNGIYGQINVSTLTRVFIKREWKKWIKAGYIVALGSDLHGTNWKTLRFDKVRKKMKHSFGKIMKLSEALIFSDLTISEETQNGE